jgi:phage tail sheath protein FI
MPDYLSPGVYIEELEGPAPISGVSTSTAALIGMAERGPVNVPILCTSPGDYSRWFGGLLSKDDFTDPVDPHRAHCYLPYAVQGFFNNLGRRAYVMRVLPAEANAAWEFLYDRTGSSPVSSVLMRNAPEGSGTAAAPLIMLSPLPPAGPTSIIRIGDGSASEYLGIAATAAIADLVALDLPLQLGHNAATPITAYARAAKAGAVGPHTLAGDAQPGDKTLLIHSPDNLAGLANWMIEVAAGGIFEIVVPANIMALGGGIYSISLSQPLANGYSSAANATAITALQSVPGKAGAAGPHTLTADAKPGDTTLSVNSPNALDTLTNWMIELDGAGVHDIMLPTVVTPGGGGNFTITLAGPLAHGYSAAPGATIVTALQAPTDTLDLAASGGDALLFASGGGLTSPNLIDIDPADPATREVRTIGTLARLSFTQPAVVDWPAKTQLSPVTLTSAAPTSLTAAAAAGSRVLSLASRAHVEEGTVLLVGTGPAHEYAVVLTVQGTRALGADPGSVVLDEGLVGSYPNGAAVVPATVDAAAPAGRRATRILLPISAGTSTAIATWEAGWAPGDIVRVSLPDGTVAFNVIAAAPTGQNLDRVTLSGPVQRNHALGAPVVSRSPLIQVQALDRGSWGRRLALAVEDEDPGLVSRAEVASLVGPTQLRLTTLTGIESGSYLELVDPSSGAVIDPGSPLKVHSVDRSTTTIRLDNALSAAQASAIGVAVQPIRLRSRELRLTVYLYRQPDPAVPSRNTQVIQTELFRNLSMDHRHSRYFESVIGAIGGPPRLTDRRPEGASWLIRTKDTAATATAQEAARLGPEALIDVLPNGLQRPARHLLDRDGDDSIATVDDQMYLGQDDPEPLNRTGIFALLNVPQISIVAIPGQGSGQVQAALIDHCEHTLYRFAVLDPAHADAGLADIQAQRQAFDTKHAAIYYPWLTIPDPMPTNLSTITDFPLPPCGHIVGIYARVDEERGVHKAPANEVVQGITGLMRSLAKGEQDILNPSPTNINVIRDFRPDGRGIRVWGARVMTSDDNFKYIPVRRLLMFIEQSIDLGLQGVVFEPNAPPLWAQVERVVGNFLTDVWRSGALEGTKPEEAFFVRCDRTTMTQTDIDNGRLIVLIGVAPVKPAEFVIIRISLFTATTNQ